MESAVRATHLAHRFATTDWLFTDLSFSAAQGEIVGLVGPSGCGKSTLLSILAGWLTPTEGRVERHDIQHVGWVFQNPHGVARRTAVDHVALPLIAQGMSWGQAHDMAEEHLTTFGMDGLKDRLFMELSGGEAQRLMLARAVASSPDLLLVDEPTAQLDRTSADTVNTVLTQLASTQTIVVIATHDPDTRQACTRIVDLAHNVPRAGTDQGGTG
ncbi:MAG: ATP-binding cassette domain-containing protein [Cellulomonadaceae bacterium]|jgi:ABC-type lipoprotein export system ATPase subunit|nr:ATP-binding cassette domain-containing protein [Cellulomonadaceae bacterium]